MLYRIIDLFSGAIIPLIIVLIFCTIKKVNTKKTILILLFTVYLAEVFDLVGVPTVSLLNFNPILNFIPFNDLFTDGFDFGTIFQFAANIVLFIPFGFLLPLIWKKFRKLLPTLIAGAVTSICIEVIQLFSFRVSALDDLLMNILGVIVGYLIITLIAKEKRKNSETNINCKRDVLEMSIVVGLTFASAILIKYSLGSFIYSLPMFK